MKLKLAHVPFYMQPTVLLLFVSVKKHNSENILLGHFFYCLFYGIQDQVSLVSLSRL